MRGNLDSTLCPAVGKVNHSRFPSHERGEGANFIEIDFMVISEASLHWASIIVVLHSETDQRFQTAVVHFYRDLYADLAARRDQ